MAKVFKFGGASIKDVDAIKNIGEILKRYNADELVIVFSAMGKVTNMLERVVKAYVQNSDNTTKYLQKVKDFHEDIINAWEILAEPIQMVARKHNISNSYELLKKNTRGKAVTKDVIHNLIKSLKIPDVEKKQLFDLTPKKYIGYAVKLCNEKY